MAENLQLLCNHLDFNSTKLYPYFLFSNYWIKKLTRTLHEQQEIWKKHSNTREKFCEICGHSVVDAFGEDSSCLAAKWNMKPAKSLICLEKIQILCNNCFQLRDGLGLLTMMKSFGNKMGSSEKVKELASHLSHVNDVNQDSMLFLQQIIAVSHSLGVLFRTLPDVEVKHSNGVSLNDSNIDKLVSDLGAENKDKKTKRMGSKQKQEVDPSSVLESSPVQTQKLKKRKQKEILKEPTSVKKQPKEHLMKKKRRKTIL